MEGILPNVAPMTCPAMKWRGAPRKPRSLEERFLEKVGPSDPVTGCRLWLGAKGANGYGQIGLPRSPGRKGEMVPAHRVALELYLGRPLQDGMDVMHSCDNGLCVEPQHLSEGSRSHNMRDCVLRGRHRHAVLAGARNPQAKLTPDDVLAIRASSLSQKDLAARFGVSRAQVGRIARGERWVGVV